MNTQKVTQEYRMNQWIVIVRECRGSQKNNPSRVSLALGRSFSKSSKGSEKN